MNKFHDNKPLQLDILSYVSSACLEMTEIKFNYKNDQGRQADSGNEHKEERKRERMREGKKVIKMTIQ